MTRKKVEVKGPTDKEDVQEEHGDARSINDRGKVEVKGPTDEEDVQ
jgi:hypothetical protein